MSYSISNFEPYDLQKYLDKKITLVWSKQNGYQFMDSLQRAISTAKKLDFKIIAVEKGK